MTLFPHYDVGVVARTPAQSDFPKLELLGPIIPVNRISWSEVLVGDPQARFGVNNDTILPQIGERLAALAEKPCEIWIWREDKLVYAGPIVGLLTKGNTTTIVAQGLLYYLRYMIVVNDYTVDKDQYAIVKDLIDQWQNLDYGNFGINTSNIGLSGEEVPVDIEADEVPNVRFEIEELSQDIGGFDYYVDLSTSVLGDTGSRDLVCGARGTDKTDRIIIDHRNLSGTTVLYQSVAVNDLATWAKVIGTTKNSVRRGTSLNTTLLPKFGRAAAVQAVDGIQTALATMEAANRLRDALAGIRVEIGGERQSAATFSIPDLTPDDVDVGDTVSVVWDVGFSVIEQERMVYRKNVSIDSEGEEHMSMEFL